LKKEKISRGSTIEDIVGDITATDGIFEIEYFPSIIVAPPKQSKNQPHRDWMEKNIEELLMGLGWRGISYTTLWVNLPSKLNWGDLFYSEFPISHKYGNQYSMDVCRVYQGRIEMESCRKPHRAAIVDLSREDRYSRDNRVNSSVEILIEKECECFYDGERNREGAFYVYAWRNRSRNGVRYKKC